MKNSLIIFAAAACLICLPAAAVEDPFSADADAAPRDYVVQIGVLVESIQLGTESATKLVREHAADADASALREKVQALIEAGEAEEVDSSYVLTAAGQRAKVASVVELIYPTEYDPPGLPSSFELDNFGDGSGFPITPCPPQAFDVRNVGSTLEVEPNWDAEAGTISLNLAPERVEFAGFIHYGPTGWCAGHPVFFVTKTQTNLTLPVGGYSIVSVQIPRDAAASGEDAARLDQSQRVLIFARATILKVPIDEEEDDEN